MRKDLASGCQTPLRPARLLRAQPARIRTHTTRSIPNQAPAETMWIRSTALRRLCRRCQRIEVSPLVFASMTVIGVCLLLR